MEKVIVGGIKKNQGKEQRTALLFAAQQVKPNTRRNAVSIHSYISNIFNASSPLTIDKPFITKTMLTKPSHPHSKERQRRNAEYGDKKIGNF
jgi:hypothetical protein